MYQKLVISFSAITVFSVDADLQIRESHLVLRLLNFSITLVVNTLIDDTEYPLIPSAVILLFFLKRGELFKVPVTAGSSDEMMKLKILLK